LLFIILFDCDYGAARGKIKYPITRPPPVE